MSNTPRSRKSATTTPGAKAQPISPTSITTEILNKDIDVEPRINKSAHRRSSTGSSIIIQSLKTTPSSSSKSNVPLTGNERVLNDTIVELHCAVIEWRKLHSACLLPVRKLGENKRGTKQFDELCATIRKSLEKMKEQASKIRSYSDRLEFLAKLQAAEIDRPYSLSWTYNDFANCAKLIVDVYWTESEMRYAHVLGMLAHDLNYDLAVTIWDLGAVDDHVLPQFETMLYEAKLKH